MQITKVLEFENKEDEDIYKEIFLTACEYSMLTFKDELVRKKVDLISFELTKKLAKVVNEKHRFEVDKAILELEILKELEYGISFIGTNKLSQDIENFLSQSTGVMDIFATKFLKNLIGYTGRQWYYEQVVHCYKKFDTKDQSTNNKIIQLLEDDQNLWLSDMFNDRHLHHESNFKLSPLSILEGKPFMYLERRNKKLSTDISGYLETNWLNLFGMIKDLTWLTFCMLNPAIKHLRLDKEYFK